MHNWMTADTMLALARMTIPARAIAAVATDTDSPASAVQRPLAGFPRMPDSGPLLQAPGAPFDSGCGAIIRMSCYSTGHILTGVNIGY